TDQRVRQTDRSEGQTDRQTDRSEGQTDRQTEQSVRQTDRQTEQRGQTDQKGLSCLSVNNTSSMCGTCAVIHGILNPSMCVCVSAAVCNYNRSISTLALYLLLTLFHK